MYTMRHKKDFHRCNSAAAATIVNRNHYQYNDGHSSLVNGALTVQNQLSQTELLSEFVLHYDGLIEFVRRKFGSPGFAADVVHDVCVQLIENPPSYEVNTPLAFFRKASVNRAIDKTRKEAVQQDYVNSASHSEMQSHSLDGAYAIEFAQKLAAMKSIIDGLPAKQRQVFLMHQLHGVSKNDIAAKMIISINMVNKHFNKAISTIMLAWYQHSSSN